MGRGVGCSFHDSCYSEACLLPLQVLPRSHVECSACTGSRTGADSAVPPCAASDVAQFRNSATKAAVLLSLREGKPRCYACLGGCAMNASAECAMECCGAPAPEPYDFADFLELAFVDGTACLDGSPAGGAASALPRAFEF